MIADKVFYAVDNTKPNRNMAAPRLNWHEHVQSNSGNFIMIVQCRLGSRCKSLWFASDVPPLRLQLLLLSGARIPPHLQRVHGQHHDLRDVLAALTPNLAAEDFSPDLNGRSHGQLTAVSGAWRIKALHGQAAPDRRGKALLRNEVAEMLRMLLGDVVSGSPMQVAA